MFINCTGVPQKNDDEAPAVKSISRAARVLSSLGSGCETITEVAHQCGFSKSTVHRLLKALEESLLVSQNPMTHRYYLGPLVSRFATWPKNTHDFLIYTAQDEMERLATLSRETVILSLLTGIKYIQLCEVQSMYDLRYSGDSGTARTTLAGATAKVLLAQIPDEELKKSLKYLDITPITTDTVTDKAVLLKELETIRRQGYGVTSGEVFPGVTCVAVPIESYVLPSALSVVGPKSRLEPRAREAARELKISAARITKAISGVFTRESEAVE